MSSDRASSSLDISCSTLATTPSRAGFAAVNLLTMPGTSRPRCIAAMLASTSLAASRSVGVSCAPAAATGPSISTAATASPGTRRTGMLDPPLIASDRIAHRRGEGRGNPA